MSMQSSEVVVVTDILASDFNTLREDILRNAGIYAVTAGTASAFTLTLDAQYTSYVAGDKITCKMHDTNVLGATMNINSIGAIPIIGIDGNSIMTSVLFKDNVAEFIYNGTSFVFVGYDNNPSLFRSSGGVITYTDNIYYTVEVNSNNIISLKTNTEAVYRNGTNQSIGRTTIWASANLATNAIIVGGYVYVFLTNTAAESRIYRCLVTADISNSANWVRITISGATLGFSTATAGLVGHDGTNFYTVEPTLGYRQFTLSGTTMTFVGNVTVTGANYSYLSGRVNHIGIYAQFAASPNFRFASHAGVLDTNRQFGSSVTQGFCTKNAFYNSSNNEIYLRNFL